MTCMAIILIIIVIIVILVIISIYNFLQEFKLLKILEEGNLARMNQVFKLKRILFERISSQLLPGLLVASSVCGVLTESPRHDSRQRMPAIVGSAGVK